MSRIGKLPVDIPSNVIIKLDKGNIDITGKFDNLKKSYNPDDVEIQVVNGKIHVKPAKDTNRSRAMWGLWRSLIFNMVKGVSEGFSTKLEINGVGYRASVDEKVLTLFLGYSHEVKFVIPADINITCEKPTSISIFGNDKQKVGQVAALIRKLRPPEPYKGKGIRYENEKINRKVGKKK